MVRRYLTSAIGRRLALLLLSAPLFAFGYADANAETLTDPRLKSMFASLGFGNYDISYGKLGFDPDAGNATFGDLELAPGKSAGQATRYTFRSAAFSGIKVAGEAVAFDSVVLEQVVLDPPAAPGAGAPLRIDRIAFSGAVIPSLSMVVVDPARPVTTQIAILRLLSAARLREVKATGLTWGNDSKIREGSLSGVASGKLAHAEIKGYSATVTGGASSDAADKIAIENVDFDPLIRLFEESAYLEAGAARPWRQFFSALTIDGLAMRAGDSKFTLVSMVIGPLHLRQFDNSLTDLMDKAALDPGTSAQTAATAQRVQAAMRAALSVDKLFLKGFSFAARATGGLQASVASSTLGGFTFEHVDTIDMADLSIADETGSLTMSRLLFGDIQLTGVFPDVVAGQIDPADGSEWPRVGRVYFNKMALKLKEGSVNIGRFDLWMRFFVGPIPTSASVTIENLVMDTKSLRVASVQEALTSLGYDYIDVSAKISGAWQDSASALAFDTISLTGKDMGTLAVSGTITGISRQSFLDPYNAFPAELRVAGLQNFRVAFTNASLYDRLIRLWANQNQMTVEQIKKSLSDNMPWVMAGIANSAIRNKFIFAAVSFINDPKILEMSTSTGDIVPLAEVAGALADPSKLPVLLKLDASANDRKSN